MKSRRTDQLIDAIKTDNYDGVASIIPFLNKITMSLPDNDGKTPLHYAIEKKNYDIVKLLLDHGADIYAPSPIGTPLVVAFNALNSSGKLSKGERDLATWILQDVNAIHNNIIANTHRHIINFIKALGYKSFDKGVCYGIAAMGAQAAMLGGDAIGKFNDRIQLINRLYDLYSDENGAINEEILTKLENLRDPKLNQDERVKILASMNISLEEYNDLNAFFQSVDIYANSQDYSIDRNFKGLFRADQHPIIQDLEIPSQFLWARDNEDKFLKRVQTFTTQINSDQNTDILVELGKMISESGFKNPVTLMVNNENHAISFTYHPDAGKWVCADAGTALNNDSKTKLLLDVAQDNPEFISGFIQHAYRINEQKAEPINFTIYCEAEVGKEFKTPNFVDKFYQSEKFKKYQEMSLSVPDQTPRFRLSVQYSDGDAIAAILQNNKKLINTSYNNLTPVSCAASNDDVAMLEKLMTFKPNLNKGGEGNTPLQIAALYNCTKTLQFLIDNKVLIDLSDLKYGNTALHFAASNDSLEAARILLENNASLKSANNTFYTPLHMAAFNGSINVAKLLIENKANVNQVTKEKETCLHLAAKEGHADMVKLLLDNGARIDVKDKNGATPLHLAASSPEANKSNVDIISLLVKGGCNINETMAGELGVRPVHVAIATDNNRLLADLIKCGADILSPLVDPKGRKHNGYIPLHWAISGGNTEAVSILLEHGADPMARNDKGETAIDAVLKSKNSFDMMRNILLHAVKSGKIDLANECLDTLGFLVSDPRCSPLLHAAESGNPGMIAMLIQRGASIFDMTSQGGCIIDMVQEKNPDLAESMLFAGLKYALKENDDIKEFFGEQGLSVNQQDKDGNTPLHHAVDCDNQSAIKRLFKSGADFNIENKKGESPLAMLKDKMQDDENLSKFIEEKMPEIYQQLTREKMRLK